jgi:tricorn protease
MRNFARLLCAVGLWASALLQLHADDDLARLLRFPATNGSQIVFSYAGQLYTVGVDGGIARRLTDGPGYAIFPRFSADGTQLAFTAQYDGNTEVYLMPADGGTPKRLTYTATLGRDDVSDRMGPNNIVMAWKNTANEIAFRSRMRSDNDFIGQLYTVAVDGDLPKQLPVPRGGFLSFSPDDSKMAYNRVFREFRTWKRYRGGMADDIWVYDFKTGAIENVTKNEAQDIIPMWAPNNKIYFLSDRDGHLNLFSYDLGTKRTAQHTTFKDYDIKFPSLGKGGIAFEQAGYVWFFDLKTEKARQVPITIKEDLAIGRGGIVNVSKYVTRVRPAPNGKRAVVVARGDIFTVPAKHGPVRNLTQTPGVHERNASWSPDGRWIAYISDATGENELWIRPQDGKGEPEQITKNADTYYYAPVWSPDSKKLLWSDRKLRLQFVDVKTKEVTLVERATNFEITDREWSPDSKWIVYVVPGLNGSNVRNDYGKLRLYSLEDKTAHDASDGWFNINAVGFSDDGKFVTFASSRDFIPSIGSLEYNHIYRDMERVYLLALAKDTESPLKPRSDEVDVAKEEEKKADAKKEKEEKPKEPTPDDRKNPTPKPPDVAQGEPASPNLAAQKKSGDSDTDEKTSDHDEKTDDKPGAHKKPVVVQVDFDGLTGRVIGLPVQPSNYSAIRMLRNKVYYVRAPSVDGPAAADARGTLYVYKLEERKETEVAGGVTDAQISADGKRILITQGKEYALVDLPSDKADLKEKLDLSELEMPLDRSAEWKQIFDESWRQMRDFFYVSNMHGLDWRAIHDKYAALLPHVRHRNDLTYLIGEMIGELNIGHAYVNGGDRVRTAPRLKTGLLGAELSRDPATRAYRIDRILRGQNWDEEARSPLTAIGVDVKEGDYIFAVNGKPVRDLPNIYAALVDTVGKQVTLRVNSQPNDQGAKDVVVLPIGDESTLYYNNWVQRNIDYVAQRTGGKVGYVHIPDMGPHGLNEFAKHFYPQLTKKALIIDDRGNGGGNVSGQIVERLRRQLVGWNMWRDTPPFANPDAALVGPMVCLLNEFSASDGDIFPYRFKTLGLGKLVGKRSWGGVVGIRGSLPFVDGGTMTKPEFTFYAPDGSHWLIEGHGVDPDIVVDNDPATEFHGHDQQLDKAIDVIIEELKTKEVVIPPPPAAPVKN